MLATLIFSAALSLEPDSGLRLLNPTDAAAQAFIRCDSGTRTVQVDPRGVADLAANDICAEAILELSEPLVAFETQSAHAVDTQRELSEQGACETVPMAIAQFGCARGTATASVNPIAGAAYQWEAEGATITGGHGTSSISLQLAENGVARLTAVIMAPGCTTRAAGAIAIRDPLAIAELAVPPNAVAGQPVTVRWTYSGTAEPRTQVLRGGAFAAPVLLGPAERSYTFTPQNGGNKAVELVGSYAVQTAAGVPPAAGRRRAVGSTLATATQCPAVTATAHFFVDGCTLPVPRITAPGQARGGEAFWASVNLAEDHTAAWSVENGTIVRVAGAEVEVLPADAATDVRLSVVVTRAADCSATSHMTIPVRPRVDCTQLPTPTATLTNAGLACRKATVLATFTGTPPFSGQWSDGTRFETSSTTRTHDFTSAGTYTVRHFADANCAGTVTSTATVSRVAPSVSLRTVGGSCTNSKLVATFAGTPPFSGRWSDGQVFTTSSYTIERSAAGLWWWHITSLYDGLCSEGQFAESNFVEISDPPRVLYRHPQVCAIAPGGLAHVTVDLRDGTPPFSVEWSDGVVTSSDTTWLSRAFVPDGWSSQMSIVKATTAGCDAVIPLPAVTLQNRWYPEINRDSPIACTGVPREAHLRNAVNPDAKLTWSITAGEILSGQGTPTVTFKAAAAGTPTLRVEAAYPDGLCTMSDTVELIRLRAGEISNVRLEPSTIKAGGTSQLKFTRDRSVEHWAIEVGPKARADDLRMMDMYCAGLSCSVPYVDTRGAAEVTFTFRYGGTCTPNSSTTPVKLTIVP